MGNTTNIEWCDSTVNPTTGCQGCELWAGQVRTCYAGQLQATQLSRAQPQLYSADFTDVRLAPGRMAKAAAWSDLRGTDRPDKPWLDGMPRTIFVGDMGDVFSAAVPFEYLRDEVFAAIESPAGRRHIWMLLTKQPQRMREVAWKLGRWPDNAWAGVSVTSQANVSRIEPLIDIPAPIRFVSAEPLLGPLSFRWALWHPLGRTERTDELDGLRDLDLVIIGGESGPKARPCGLGCVLSVVRECQAASVCCFVKQVGSRPVDDTHTGMPWVVRDPKGGDPSEWPDIVRVRELPRFGSAVKA